MPADRGVVGTWAEVMTDAEQKLMVTELGLADDLFRRILDMDDHWNEEESMRYLAEALRWRRRYSLLHASEPVHLTLGQLITMLETYDGDELERLPVGIGRPHSYRGEYSQVAFEPTKDVPVLDMLATARAALGARFTGYKGGEFVMHSDTLCYLTRYGQTGEPLTNEVLTRMTRREYEDSKL